MLKLLDTALALIGLQRMKKECGDGYMRKPYAREFTQNLPREVVFCGTTKACDVLQGASAFSALRARWCKELESLDRLGGGSSL